MPGRRFFVLDETCPSSEIPHMMGRVVADKLLPLQKFAPFSPSSSSTAPPHNPEDIVSDILPTPSLSKNRKELLAVAAKHGLSVALGCLFGTEFARTTEEKVQLESELVRQYTLNNPDEYFDLLMENELYAQDVQKLLARTKRGRAYLVTGFLTTSGTLWTRTHGQSHSTGFFAALPIAEVVSAGSLPGLQALVDPTVAPSRTTNMELQRQMSVADEEIFAVSYSPVKIKYRIDRKASHFTKKTPTVGPPKRANLQQLALGDEEGEEGSETAADPANADVFLLDDDEEDEAGDENAPFLELELEID